MGNSINKHVKAQSSPTTLPKERCTVEALLHELQVYQIELEMQNETLRQTQLELEESRDRYQNLYDFAPVAYLTLTPDAVISEINLTGACLLRMERKRLINSRFGSYIASHSSERWGNYFGAALKNNNTQRCELELLRGDGSVFIAHLDCLHMSADNAGHSVRIALTDVTERNQAEARLHESVGKFRAIFEGTLDGIVLANEVGMIVDCNREFMRQTGMTLEQLKQTRIWELRPADKIESAKEKFLEILESGSGSAVDLKFKQANGQVIHVEFRSTVNFIGDKRYLQSISRDITERKRVEAELREYQQLLRELAAQGVASREAELKHIAREVHDELGQLLTALRMDISLLRIQFGGHNPMLMGRIQDMLGLLDKAIGGVRNVTTNLRPSALNMGLVPAIAWLCDEFFDRTNTVCALRVIDNPADLSEAQTTTLFRIVQESLTNVARYAQATRVKITIRKCGEDIAIAVCDDGKGFDPASKPTNKSFGLLGMRERALALGGKFDVASEPSKGTVVSIHIPLFQSNPEGISDDSLIDSRRPCDCARRIKENLCINP